MTMLSIIQSWIFFSSTTIMSRDIRLNRLTSRRISPLKYNGIFWYITLFMVKLYAGSIQFEAENDEMTPVLYWVKLTSSVSFRNYFQFLQSLKKVQFTGMNIFRKKKFFVIHFFM